MIHTAKLSLRPSAIKGAGLGLFAEQPFAPGDVVLADPVLPFSAEESKAIMTTTLGYFCFRWAEDDDGCMVLGHGSLVNHSYEPNCVYTRDLESRHMIYTAIRPVAPGDEITINYNGTPDSKHPVWFDCYAADGTLIHEGNANW